MKIAVRGGHNEKVRGASGFVDEVVVDRAYYPLVIKYLKDQGHEVLDVTPTRTDTKTQDLGYGVSSANSWEADLFISCHVNSSNGEGHGCEVIYHSNSTKGKEYAARISESISNLGFKNRGEKADARGLYEINHTKMTSIIIEPFFLDNKADVDIYKRIGPRELARAIVGGIFNKEIKQEDEEMIANTVKLAACKYNPIATQIIEEIKLPQGVVGLNRDGIAREELLKFLN